MRCNYDEYEEAEFYSQYALKLMETALKNVDPAYVHSYLYENEFGDEMIYEQVERSFAYELYHQLRLLSKYEDILGKKIVINAEIPKIGYPTKSGLDESGHVFPDIVIHGGQEDHSPNNQLLVCEIKRNAYEPLKSSVSDSNVWHISKTHKLSQTDIKRDLAKLAWYVKELIYKNQNGSFMAGCFVMTNTSIEDLRSVIKDIKAACEKDTYTEMPISRENTGDDSFNWKSIWEVAGRITIFSYMEDESGKPKVGKFRLDKMDEIV